MSGNHNQSLDRALEIVEAAAKTGAQAIKLQTYTADTITLDVLGGDFEITDPNSLWKNTNLHKLYQQAYTPWQWHKPIFDHARKLGLEVFSSPFDETAVDFLEELGVPCYKIASFENTDLPLIRRAAATGKPLIISTGMANLKEIDLAYKTAKNNGAKEIILLYCVSNYPSKISDFNLNNIRILKERYNCKVGFSDHSIDNKVVAAAIAAGAEVVEKHIALERQKKGFDIAFSLKGTEIKDYVKIIKETFLMMGKKYFYRNKSEKYNLQFRRSIYTTIDIKKGERFSKKNIKVIRPGFGIQPVYFEKLINKKSPFSIKSETPLKKSLLKRLKIFI
jgi:N-acetylneuraminate synthase